MSSDVEMVKAVRPEPPGAHLRGVGHGKSDGQVLSVKCDEDIDGSSELALLIRY